MKNIARRIVPACAAGAGLLALSVFAQPSPPSSSSDRGSSQSAPAEDAATPSETMPSETRPSGTADAQDATTRTVETILASWPSDTRSAARAMMAKYGQPKEFSNEALVWLDNNPWKKTVVYRVPSSETASSGSPSSSSTPGSSTDTLSGNGTETPGQTASAAGGAPGISEGRDYLEQTISYKVPTDKTADVARFDPRIKVDPSRGEISSRAETEGQNFLALNLADEVINGRRTPEEARDFYMKTSHLSRAGKSSPYMDGLRFQVNNAEPVSPVSP